MRLAKLAVHKSYETDIHTGILIERLIQSVLFETTDKKEGMDSFLDKRTPHFTGQ
ncbi:Clp protease/crotonase-like domain-containing protein [Evansella halocellulosilytica]|uniref:hypothetical protein n=1 Tax=Evansella halocellulosilytica TaxID=2011013 RepID=UPI0027BA735B|nr:hypothetical protein [Evansella halocellulosilytica]